jgi:hypothetical protein
MVISYTVEVTEMLVAPAIHLSTEARSELQHRNVSANRTFGRVITLSMGIGQVIRHLFNHRP